MTHGPNERDEIVEAAVAQGQVPGVVAGGQGRRERAADETGMPAVCDDAITAARAAG